MARTLVLALLACACEGGEVLFELGVASGAGGCGLCSAGADTEKALLGVRSVEKGDAVVFATPQGKLRGEANYVCRDVNGMEARAGMLDDEAGTFRLVAGPNVLYGVVEDCIGDMRYEITGRLGDGAYEVAGRCLSEYQASIPEGGPPQNPSLYGLNAAGASFTSLTPEEEKWAADWDNDEVVELTILLIFSHDTIAAAGSLEAANAKAAAGMALCNQAMVNSKIPARLSIAGTYLSDYEETEDSGLDLARLQAGVDGFEFVPGLRDRLAADFVVYAPRVMTAGWAGLGYVSGSPTGSPDLAYHVVLYSFLEDLSWIHEWGHNIGCNHSYEQNSSPGPEDGGLFGHSLGCYFYATNLTKRCLSIMTYRGNWNGVYYGYRAPYFSGPELSYGGSAVSYNDKTRCALVWRKVRKYASLYRKREVLTSFDCSFAPEEGYYEGDACYQMGLKPLEASGKIIKSGSEYYLHTAGGEGFEMPLNVKSDDGLGSYKVSVRVKPRLGSTHFDVRGESGSLFYLNVSGDGGLNLNCAASFGGAIGKVVQLGSAKTDWQQWTVYFEEESGEITGYAVNGEEKGLTGCYVAQNKVMVDSVRLKDRSAAGADFDDVHVESGVALLEARADMIMPGAVAGRIDLTNLNSRTSCKFAARILEGGECFSLSPESGVLRDYATIQVGIANLPSLVGYKECLVEIDGGNAGKRVLRFGAPCGSKKTGYGLYAANFENYPLGPLKEYDSRWEAAEGADCDIGYMFDHYVKEVLLEEDYENYSPDQSLGTSQGWSGGYGTLGKDGTVIVREGHEGGKYVEIAYVNDLIGAHRSLDSKMVSGWWEGHLKGYFRVSFDAMLTGGANKYFGFWDPQMVEGNFERSGSGFRFRSNASDVAEEFVSQNPIPEGTWKHVSMIVEAVPVKSGAKYRHILRQYKVDDLVEDCYAPLDQSNSADYFNTLRFFLWGEGTFCLDNLKVETLVSETDYEILDFPDKDPMKLNVKGGAALCSINLDDELAWNYNLSVQAKFIYPEGLPSFVFGQDDFSRQFTTTFTALNETVKPLFNDCQKAGTLSKFEGFKVGEAFAYGYEISTVDKSLRSLYWNGKEIKANLAIEGANKSKTVQAIRIMPSSGELALTELNVVLLPREEIDPQVSWEMEPFVLGEKERTLYLTNKVAGSRADFRLSLAKGGSFGISPDSGRFERWQKVTVTALETEGAPEYVTDELTIDCGAGGKAVLRLGHPKGSEEEGYVLYSADYAKYPAGDPREYDLALKGGADVLAESGLGCLKYGRSSERPAGEGGLFVKAGLKEGYGDYVYDFAASLQIENGLRGSLAIGQDKDHRQMQGVIVQDGAQLSLQFSDSEEASALAGKGPGLGETFDYGICIRTAKGDKEFLDFKWNGAGVKVDAPISAETVMATEAVDYARFCFSQKGQELKIYNVRISLTPGVPEPAALILAGLALAVWGRRRTMQALWSAK